MFILHSSNKTENLLEHLKHIIGNAPLNSPFDKEVFLIQSQGMERWLAQQLASKFQVFANFDFLFPGGFFTQMARKINQQLNTDIFARELMVWRFELLLRDLDEPVFLPLKLYLRGENSELKRFQLATHLAQVFDQYQMMRPTVLNEWQQGKLHYGNDSEKWQQALWHKLIAQTGDQHRGALWLKTIAQFNATEEGGLSDYLPQRISIFGLNTMPPLFMEFLQGLARHTEVHFYLLNPAQAFWADIVAKKRADLEEFENGHPLLASLGQQGREFQQMILDRAFSLELDSFEENEAESLSNLQQLQNDILNNLTAMTEVENDHSISIHSCHSRMREVEVLKDQLLHALESDSSIELREIVVMAPDIQQYAPFISAVFNDIQHAIADRSLRSSNHSFDAFLRFIRLTQGRFGWQEVMDLLSQSEVYHCFDLSESDVELIRYWVAETQIRWGKSAAHKQQLNLPESPENTWLAGLERLLMGYAVGSDEDFFAGVLPYTEIEGMSAQALGGLYSFLQLLFRASSKLAKSYSLEEWGEALLEYADLLFPAAALDSAQQVDKQQMNDIFLELKEQFSEVHQEPLSLAVILAWLEERVEEIKSSNGFLRGQLTFCSMLPMRTIPFKVIALLGMNEGEFPHIDHHLTFDLLGKDFQAGDRSRRADDRYQFLEILLSARQQVIMTYMGQTISENETIPASVVIHELLDIMQQYYQLNDLVTKHPLQSFSARYFQADSPLISYSHSDYATMNALMKKAENTQAWWQGELKSEASSVIEISDLCRFYRHPQRYFLQQSLNIRLEGVDADEQEHEPFVIEGMDSYVLNHQWIDAKLNERDLSLDKLKAEGRWISGELGVTEFNRREQEIQSFVEKIESKQAGASIEPIAVDLTVAEKRLIGSLGNQYADCSLIYRYSPLKGKDFMAAWLQHLILNRQNGEHITHLISQDEYLSFLPEHIQGDELEQLLVYYQAGQQQPNAFFTEAAFAYVKQQAALNNPSSRSRAPALAKAETELIDSIAKSYEPELYLLYKTQEDVDDLLNDDFESYCLELLLPAWEAASAA
ncbi:MAG: exodeoxyribonuclease V subunit gamma [Methyloprofundus sp.]|nr:exodeoxyribonuclease V subunit gamma [Methyloprofundus sp.]